MAGRFSKQQSISGMPSSRTLPMEVFLDARGLDLVNPHDSVKKGRTPYARDFRLYESGSDVRRVAVTSRTGSREYMKPLNESLDYESNKTVTGNQTMGTVINTKIQKLEGLTVGNLITKIDVMIGHGGKGLIRADIYSGDEFPDTRVGESSLAVNPNILAPIRFIDAPEVEADTTYWLVMYIQDDGEAEYDVPTTDGAGLHNSNGGTVSITNLNCSLIYDVHTSPKAVFKGAYRYNSPVGVNRTVAVYDTTMYYVRDGKLVPFVTGLSDEATEYDFTVNDGKLFWVNGYDKLMSWNGWTGLDYVNGLSNGSFNSDTTGWTKWATSTIARNTTEYRTSPASLYITNTGTNQRGVDVAVDMEPGKRYKISFWAKSSASNVKIRAEAIYGVGSSFLGVVPGSELTLTSSWQKVEAWYTPGNSKGIYGGLRFLTLNGAGLANGNFYIDDVTVEDTGIDTILEAPILYLLETHYTRLWGVTSEDKNQVVYSENPGNPTNNPERRQWYYYWHSASYAYAPTPRAQDPIVSIASFQDSMIAFTATGKYVISGDNRATVAVREAVSMQGAINNRGTLVYRNLLYFVGKEGIYQYDGAKDINIAANVQPEFDNCPVKNGISAAAFDKYIYFYYGDQSINNRALIYHIDYGEVLMDTGINVDYSLSLYDGDDDIGMIQFHSKSPYASILDPDVLSDSGKPIDFEYRFKYNSMGSPAQKKRIKKLFPLFEAVYSTFPIIVGMDKNFENNPNNKVLILSTDGSKWADFDWGEGSWGGDTSFNPRKVRYSGDGYYWQLRVSRKAVNNKVALVGAQFNYKIKRL